MVRPLPLMEVPFLLRLPQERMGLLHLDLTMVELVRVEAFPKQGKWVLHLSTSHDLSGRQLLTLMMSDKSDSISAKVFLEEGQESLDLKEGEWVKVRGSVQYDRYNSELTLMPKDMLRTLPVIREDHAKEKRIELHLHTRMSTMDGMSSGDVLGLKGQRGSIPEGRWLYLKNVMFSILPRYRGQRMIKSPILSPPILTIILFPVA